MRTTELVGRVTVADVGSPGTRAGLANVGDGLTFGGSLSLPPGRHILRVVVADKARNEADQLVTVEVPR